MRVRSQDKLSSVNLNIQDIYIAVRPKGFEICSGRGHCLGSYKTKEKAIHVLDIIHEKIIEYDRAIFLGMSESKYVSCIFEMPEDSEVE